MIGLIITKQQSNLRFSVLQIMFYPDISVLMSASALKPLDLAYVIMPLRSLTPLADHHNRVSNWMRSSRDVDVFARVDQIENQKSFSTF